MIDARAKDTIRSWIDKLTLGQELIVLSGVILFLAGLAVSTIWLKGVLILLSTGIIASVVLLVRRSLEQEEERSVAEEVEATAHQREDQMKKLVFDDFQPVENQYKVEVTEVAEALPPPRAFVPRRNVAATSQKDIEALIDVEEEAMPRESGPKSEFAYLLRKVLTVVKEVNFAHTVAFYWVNRTKQQIVLESYVTDSQRFAPHRRRELADDLVSQVAKTGQPKVLNDVNALAQTEMLGYYDGVEPVKTFLGIPIFYRQVNGKKGEPVAVLVVDSLSDDVFGPETFTLLGQFTKLISSLIHSYTDKYDLLLDSETLRSITRMTGQWKLDFGLQTIARSLAEETSRLTAWDYIAVVLYDEPRKAWTIQHLMNRMNDAYVAPAQEVDPHESLVGTVIQTCVPKIVDNVKSLTLPRYYPAERGEAAGALIALPIYSFNRCYGALVVESKDAGTYSESDVKLLQKLVESSSWALETLSLTDVVNNYVLMDETTGVATRKFFLGRLQEEIQRASDFEEGVALVIVSIDGMNDHLGRHGKDGFDFILQNVGRMIKTSIRPYDLIGRFDFNKFAALLVNTTANEAFLWAEKLRKNIASNVINIEEKSFSVTICAGVCATANGMSDMELLENANQVLKKATEAGGNVVRVF